VSYADHMMKEQTRLLLSTAGFLRRFRDPIRVPRITENYHWVPKIR